MYMWVYYYTVSKYVMYCNKIIYYTILYIKVVQIQVIILQLEFVIQMQNTNTIRMENTL